MFLHIFLVILPILVPTRAQTTPATGLIGVNVLTNQGPLGGDLPPGVAPKDKPWSLIAVDIPLGNGVKLLELHVLRFPPLPKDGAYVKYYNGVAIVLLVNDRLSWKDAAKKCQSHGLQPTSFDSADEFSFHMKMLNDNKGRITSKSGPWPVWTAGNDLYRPGLWTWISSGRPVPGFYGGGLSTNSTSGGGGCGGSGLGTGNQPWYIPEEGKHCLQIQHNLQSNYGGVFDTNCLQKGFVMCKEANY